MTPSSESGSYCIEICVVAGGCYPLVRIVFLSFQTGVVRGRDSSSGLYSYPKCTAEDHNPLVRIVSYKLKYLCLSCCCSDHKLTHEVNIALGTGSHVPLSKLSVYTRAGVSLYQLSTQCMGSRNSSEYRCLALYIDLCHRAHVHWLSTQHMGSQLLL